MRHTAECSDNFRVLDESFERNFSDSLHKQDSEYIHELRVTIKKIKAFFHLLESASAGFDAGKSFRIYKKIFKRAGRVRDWHVQLMLLDRLEKELNLSLPSQRLKIREYVRKEYEAFREYSKTVDKDFHNKVSKHVLNILKKDFSPTRANGYILRQAHELVYIANQPEMDFKDLHKFRILLKDYFYNIGYMNDCRQRNIFITKHIDRINGLQDDIGKWHDQITMFDFLIRYRQGRRFAKVELRVIQKLQDHLQKDTQEMTENLVKRFPRLVSDLMKIDRLL